MNSVLSVYAICVVVLLLKMLAISCYQGYFRLRCKIFTNPEDAAVFRRSAEFEECPKSDAARKPGAMTLKASHCSLRWVGWRLPLMRPE